MMDAFHPLQKNLIDSHYKTLLSSARIALHE